MYTNIQKIKKIKSGTDTLYLVKSFDELNATVFSYEELSFIESESKNNKKTSFSFNRFTHWDYIEIVKEKKNHFHFLESLRVLADKYARIFNEARLEFIGIQSECLDTDESLAFAEGLALANYQFNKYKTDKETKFNSLQNVFLQKKEVAENQVEELNILTEATLTARTLVNEPVSNLMKIAPDISAAMQVRTTLVYCLHYAQSCSQTHAIHYLFCIVLYHAHYKDMFHPIPPSIP